MKIPSPNPKWIIAASLALWFVFLLEIGIPGLPYIFGHSSFVLLPIIAGLATILSVVSLAIVFLGVSGKDEKNKALSAKPPNDILHQVLATAIIVALISSTYCAVMSLSIDSFEKSKFVYNNLASFLGFAVIVLIFILSALQRDVYWFSQKRAIKLDERQAQERHEVFEMSYKTGAWLVLAAATLLACNKTKLPAIINNSMAAYMYGAMFWPFFNVALTLFALPLIIAVFKKKEYKKSRG